MTDVVSRRAGPLSRRAGAMGLSVVLAAGVAVAVPDPAGASSTKSGASVAALIPKAASFPTLRYGSRGMYVRNLQWKLRMQITGYFGPVTLRNVKRFQRAKGLPATGVVTAATWRLLKAPPKTARSSGYPTLRYGSRGMYVRHLQWRLRMQITGYFGPVTLRNVKNFQRAKGLPVTGVVTAPTWRLLKPPAARVAPRASRTAARTGIRSAVAGLNWRALARCESGGRPTAVNPAGYYGLYQFNLGTWRSVGGKGYPHRATAAEQLYRAQILYQRRGSQPWPHCGRLLYT